MRFARRFARTVTQPEAFSRDDVVFVTTLYQTLLGREPDAAGLQAYLTALRAGTSRASIAHEFLRSPEFGATIGRYVPLFALPLAPEMHVDLSVTADQERALWAHVAAEWSALGESDPYRSVLNTPEWGADHMSDGEAIDAFYATGEHDVDRLLRWLARNQLPLPTAGTCAEYGCGLGRHTIWLARRFARVLAFDISAPHLEVAAARAAAAGLTNVEFVHVRQASDLQRLAGVDLFYSIIVLQHNPPPLILAILKQAFDGLNPGGIAYFQVPTYARDYRFDLREYLQQTELSMEMHFVPQRAIFELALAHGMRPVEVTPDDMIGNTDRWISTSFLMAK